MISAQAQAIIDEVTAIRALDQAAVTAVNGLVVQIASLKQTVDDLKAQAGEAGPISALDLTAIQEALTGLHDTATALQAAIPVGTGAPTDPVTGAAVGSAGSGAGNTNQFAPDFKNPADLGGGDGKPTTAELGTETGSGSTSLIPGDKGGLEVLDPTKPNVNDEPSTNPNPGAPKNVDAGQAGAQGGGSANN